MHRVKIDRFGRVLIPKKVRDRLGLGAGEEMALGVEGDRLILEHQVPRDVIVRKGRALVFDVEGQSDIRAAQEWQSDKRTSDMLFGDIDV
jgi:AbrB family looped-hinge helix DNA binding protein